MHTQITNMLSIYEMVEKKSIESDKNAECNSLYIESLILGVPLNVVVNNDKVIQGAEIVASYEAFMNNELVLEGVITPDLKGKKQSELEPHFVRNVKTKPVMFTYVKIDENIAKNIFNQ